MFHLLVLERITYQKTGIYILLFGEFANRFTHRTFNTVPEQYITMERVINRIRRYERIFTPFSSDKAFRHE